jgi:hypothetical protein
MASNGRDEVSLCKCMLYHSASRRSNNRFRHISTTFAPIAKIRTPSPSVACMRGSRPTVIQVNPIGHEERGSAARN